MSRDFDANPYSADEQRVAKFFFDAGIGGGDDPIGSLIASHQALATERNTLRSQAVSALEVHPSELMGEIARLQNENAELRSKQQSGDAAK